MPNTEFKVLPDYSLPNLIAATTIGYSAILPIDNDNSVSYLISTGDKAFNIVKHAIFK